MGPGGISVGSLLLILGIVLLLFGTKKIRNLGGDLGGAIKGFRKAMHDEPAADEAKKLDESVGDSSKVYDVKAEKEEEPKKPGHS